MKHLFAATVFAVLAASMAAHGQAIPQPGADTLSKAEKNTLRDQAFIDEVEDMPRQKPKVLHAEPLYIDLLRDLGARKGEHEWNLGLGTEDQFDYDSYEALIEYEWAPMDRLGLEVELPFSWSRRSSNVAEQPVPDAQLDGLKMGLQYTFLVSDPLNLSMALGALNTVGTSTFGTWGQGGQLFEGNKANPLLIVAKRWGNNFHSMLYTGYSWFVPFRTGDVKRQFEAHTSFHYMISGTRNFVGIETNQYVSDGTLSTVFRPQIRVGLAENLLVGIVSGIPATKREGDGMSAFLRVIYEPRSPSTQRFGH